MDEHDLENDLKNSTLINEKVQGDKVYAQNLYAALCNNDFIKNEPWPLLKDEKWSCSWRTAGAIVAEINNAGDYMSYYCSGMAGNEQITPPEDVQFLSEEEQELVRLRLGSVEESVVTDEIRKDLLVLGWVVRAD